MSKFTEHNCTDPIHIYAIQKKKDSMIQYRLSHPAKVFALKITCLNRSWSFAEKKGYGKNIASEKGFISKSLKAIFNCKAFFTDAFKNDIVKGPLILDFSYRNILANLRNYLPNG